MLETVFSSNRDAILAAIPLIGALLLGFFRLDALFATPPRIRPRRPASGVDRNGQPIFCDPDGRRQSLRK